MRRLVQPVLSACLIACAGASALSQDWPQFRGPDGQGHSTERGLPTEWSESKNVAWKVSVPGRGWSSPVVADGKVWLTTATSVGRESSLRLLSFDAATGRPGLEVEVFRLRDSALLNAKNSHASPTPIVEADRVYVHFGAQGTAALSTTGDVIWKTRQVYESQHGNGGSPVLYGELLIFSCDGFDEAFIVALDKRTGKTRWRTLRPQPWSQAYSTPLVIRVADRDQIVSVGAFHAAAYDPQNGKEIWRVSYPDGFSNVPRPVYGNGLVFITTGFQQPAILAIRPDGKGDVTRTHVAWTLTRGAPLTPSPLLVGDELYVVTDAGIASSIDARTGAIRWQHRLGEGVSASPVLADGRIYVLDEQGRTTVIALGQTFMQVATNVLDGPALASMAVASRSFFIRTATHLYRIASGGADRVISRAAFCLFHLRTASPSPTLFAHG
jgi:outer membrane protein assembly factor BamB